MKKKKIILTSNTNGHGGTEFIYQMNFDHRLVVQMACEITPLGSRTMQRSYGKLFRAFIYAWSEMAGVLYNISDS